MAWCGYGLEVPHLQLPYLLYCLRPTTLSMLRFVLSHVTLSHMLPQEKQFSSLVFASWETLVCMGVMRIEEHWTTSSWIYYIVYIRCKYWQYSWKIVGDASSWCLISLSRVLHIFCHMQIVLELPVEHGLLVENLLDLAHAPFTHTTTFARGWKVPRWVSYIHNYSRVVN
jgi:hypothetical protein